MDAAGLCNRYKMALLSYQDNAQHKNMLTSSDARANVSFFELPRCVMYLRTPDSLPNDQRRFIVLEAESTTTNINKSTREAIHMKWAGY